MRKWIFGILLLFLLPIAFSMDECQREEEPKDIPCAIFSSYLPSAGCTADIFIYLENGSLLQTNTWDTLGVVCNSTWNISDSGTYIYNSTIESGVITIKGVDDMTSLSVTLFILIVNALIFLLPSFVTFTDNEVLNNLMSKMVYILGLGFLAFNTTIIVTLADNAALGITSELFTYQWLFLRGLYVAMIFLFWNLVVSTLQMWKLQKTKKRMGEGNE